MTHYKKTRAILPLALVFALVLTLFPAATAHAANSIMRVLAKPELVFDQVYPFYEGMAAVKLDGKYGFVNQTGQLVIDNVYDDVHNFSEGRAAVRKGDKWGFVDNTGDVKVDFLYDETGDRFSPKVDFCEGRAAVRKGDKWGFVDLDGTEVIPIEYFEVVRFSDGLAHVNGGNAIFVDTDGNPILRGLDLDNEIRGILTVFSEGFLGVEGKNEKWGYADQTGQIVIPCEYDHIGGIFSEGLTSVMKDGKWGIVDIHNDIVVPFVYDYVGLFSEGLAFVRDNEKYGVVNTCNELVLPIEYEYIRPFSEGLAAVKKDGRWGFIGKDGRVTVPIVYDFVSQFVNGLALVKRYDGDWNSLYSYIDGAGIVVSLDYDWVYFDGIFDEEKLTSIDMGDQTGPFWTKKNGKYGIIQPAAMSDAEIIAADKDALTWATVKKGNETPNSVTTDLVLPVIGANGANINWASTDTSVISGAGVVTRPANGAGNKTVTLTATITHGGASDQVTFDVTVLEKAASGSSNVGGGGGVSNAIVSPTTAVFDKNTESSDYKDIVVALSLNGRKLKNIKLGSDVLTVSQYTVSGNTYTFKKEYLAAMEVGIQSFIFEMDDGNNPTLIVTIADTATVIDVNPPMAGPLRYDDVVSTDWFYDAVEVVSDKNLMNGTQSRTFSPYAATTRAMLVTMLYRLEGKPAVTGSSPFSDVKNGQWYTDAVIWASQSGIVEGYDNGQFGWNDPVTREQAVTIFYRYAKAKGLDVSAQTDLSKYADMNEISDWALEAVKWAVAEGVIQGRTATTTAPKGTSTRAEIATIFKRYLDINFS